MTTLEEEEERQIWDSVVHKYLGVGNFTDVTERANAIILKRREFFKYTRNVEGDKK